MRPITILYETDQFLAIDKPSGLLSIPDRYDPTIESAFSLLLKRYPHLFKIHRLDKLTSGILLFAKDEDTHRYLSGLFEQRRIVKEYTAIIAGTPPDESGEISAPIAPDPSKKGVMKISRQGKNATTLFKVVKTFSTGYTQVNFSPLTGRTHQIRVHARYFGHPIICDPVYGDGKPIYLSALKRNYHAGKNMYEERPLIKRLALHASSIRFQLPDNTPCHITAPLPKDIKALINQLGKL